MPGYRILTALGVILLVLAIYYWIARPYQLNWGATHDEIGQAMPGDELDQTPTFLATRGITINGTPEQIWPWLLQMGYNRAGFYGYDLIENQGSTSGMKSAESILPEYQQFKVGDVVPISAAASMKFFAIEPDRYVIWTGENGVGGFTWALYPIDKTQTRLISRIRWTHHLSPPVTLAFDVFTEIADPGCAQDFAGHQRPGGRDNRAAGGTESGNLHVPIRLLPVFYRLDPGVGSAVFLVDEPCSPGNRVGLVGDMVRAGSCCTRATVGNRCTFGIVFQPTVKGISKHNF